MLRNRYRAIQRNHRRRPDRHQLVVEPRDPSPIRFLRARRAAVGRGDRGLHVIFRQLRSRRRKIQHPLPFADQPRIPLRPVLFQK